MNKTEAKLEYRECESRTSGIPVIIVAAGMSVRMEGMNKQLAVIGGIPVLARTLLAFERCRAISNIILVVKTEDIFEIQMMTEKYMIKKLSDIVCGGSSRQQSVIKGLSRIDVNAEKVLIHDGARPLVSDEIICSVAAELEKCPAVTCAVKVKDTIKRIDESGKVLKTLERDFLVAVQTPQGVCVEKYKKAVERAGNVDLFTDDVSIMEMSGYDVHTVEGSYSNIKITTPDDITLAEGYILREEEQ